MIIKYLKFNFFNEKIKINFFNTELGHSVISLIIGKNGTRKSYLLRYIVEIFRYLEMVASDKASKDTILIEIQYFCKGKLIEVNAKDSNKIIIKVDQKEIPAQELNEFLPSSLLAISTTLNDRFIFVKDDEEYMYKYLGIRTAANVAFKDYHLKKALADFLERLQPGKEGKEIFEKFNKIIKFLGGTSIKIIYKFKTKALNRDSLTINRFKEKQASLVKKNKYSSSKINEITEKQLENSVEFVKKMCDTDSNGIAYKIHINDTTNEYNFNDEALKVLSSLQFIEPPTLEIAKDTSEFFGDLSTGEANVFHHFLNIITHIKDNSLVIIDEPEISLHPTWQRLYLRLLRDLTKGTKSHIILATHSHFFVSDLIPNDSTLHMINPNISDNYGIQAIEHSTYSWSPEAVLYRVFQVRMFNSYLQKDDINTVLQFLATPKETRTKEKIEAIHEIVRALEPIIQNGLRNDPLKVLLTDIKQSFEREK